MLHQKIFLVLTENGPGSSSHACKETSSDGIGMPSSCPTPSQKMVKCCLEKLCGRADLPLDDANPLYKLIYGLLMKSYGTEKMNRYLTNNR